MQNTIPKNQAHFLYEGINRRVDHYLKEALQDHSRSSLQNLIDQGHVAVNGTPIKKSGYIVKPGDSIDITFAQPALIDKTIPHDIGLQIIAQTEDFAVINKPAGLLTHHAPCSKDEVSLVNGLKFHYQDFDQFGDELRPGIVHRLDKHTSGLILIAKNPQAQRVLSEQFKARTMHKKYLAVVDGHPPKEGTISYAIGRHPTKRHLMSHVGIAKRDAFTSYKVLAYYKDSSLVEFSPLTGRTHQIRVHAVAIGHRIIGDELYNKTSPHIARQALHAWQLSFEYKGTSYSFRIPIPDDMKQLIAAMRSR